MIEKTACFTGHRPEKIFKDKTDINAKLAVLKKCLQFEIGRALDDGYECFISGMARGTDIFSAEIVLRYKSIYPNIKLICAIPFPGQSQMFSGSWKLRYENILKQCDESFTVCDTFSNSAYMIRNRYMVDRSSRVIAVFNGQPGGTANTIEYARKKGKQIVIINPEDMIC